jgi:cyclopropane fatty-acyl-phospholipid synthase-like methyltransferase
VGAGEGKNAVFLANMNANVTAVDVSEIALSRFARQPNYENCSQRITIIKEDIRNLSFRDEEFDIIVAYGVLHCLDSKEEIFSMVGSIKKWLKKGGYFVCATFTDEIPIPKVQTYLNEKSLLSQGELEGSLDDFEILNSENSIISEIHPTTNIEHKHSIVRIIAQKHE